MSIKDLIQANPTSTLIRYRKGILFYQCGGLTFRVPCDDTGDGTFEPVMRSITMMRWIRKELAAADPVASEAAS